MGYYCTVPQCTSLAGKTKNVKFHRFPRDDTLACKWNDILHRNKPYTKYSKVCSRHFTQADYNVTSMGKKTGQWKTLNKDAIPTQNLPRLNSDGSVMVIRKSRSLKSKPDSGLKKENEDISSEKRAEWMANSSSGFSSSPASSTVAVAMNTGDTMQVNSSHHSAERVSFFMDRITKHDADIQTDPIDINSPTDQPAQPNHEETDLRKAYSEMAANYRDAYDKQPKNYSKETLEDYTQISESYLDRSRHSPYQKSPLCKYGKEKSYEMQYYNVPLEYGLAKSDPFDRSSSESQENLGEGFSKGCFDPAEALRGQQQGMSMLHEQVGGERLDDRFYAGRIKEEASTEEDAYGYQPHKENGYVTQLLQQQERLRDLCERRTHIKSEPGLIQNCDPLTQNLQDPLDFYRSDPSQIPPSNVSEGYYSRHEEEQVEQQSPQPGPEMLIAKQNALAATLWPNSPRRPFYYSEGPHSQLNTSLLQARYEDMNRLMNQ